MREREWEWVGEGGRERGRGKEKKERHLFAGRELRFRLIMNMNTGSNMQLSANCCQWPKG